MAVSLRLARRDKHIRLEVSGGHRLIVTPGVPGPHPEYLVIRIVNVGHREAEITSIGWKVGIFKKRYGVQSTDNDGISSSLPIRLRDGEVAQYFVRLNEETKWLENFTGKMLMPFPRLRAYFVQVQASTSIGDVFESRIEKGLRKKLVAAIKPNKAA